MIRSFRIILFSISVLIASCTFTGKENSHRTNKEKPEAKPEFPYYVYSEENSFPKEGTLDLPEDGAGLPDGRILVADNEDGLHLIEKDGSHRSFGNMKEAGYSKGGARGVFLEEDAKHVLVSCINSGEIYRVNTETESSEHIYRHKYGVNNLYKDKNGNIWFSQSATNKSGSTKALDEAFGRPLPTGALYLLPKSETKKSPGARLVADSLYFANGITMDEEEKNLFVSEFRMDRILSFKVENDRLVDKEQFSVILSPDNLERDKNGNIWVASLIQNKIFALAIKDRSRQEIFSARSKMNDKKQKEWVKKTHLGKSVIDIGHPDMWQPLTGPLTGVFWSFDQKEVYFTGLGTKILKYPFKEFN